MQAPSVAHGDWKPDPAQRESVRRVRRRAELAKLEAEIQDARPFVPLAREIHEEVARAAAGGSTAESLVDAIEAVPRRERRLIALAVLDRLPSDRQWAIIERASATTRSGWHWKPSGRSVWPRIGARRHGERRPRALVPKAGSTPVRPRQTSG
jgi:hypothetical protein